MMKHFVYFCKSFHLSVFRTKRKPIAELLTTDKATSLMELAEYAIERVENALGQIDDSYGEVSGTVEALGNLHLKACAMALPEPLGLAERLFWLEITLPFNVCSFDVVTYRDIIGNEGLRRYRITRVIPTIIDQSNNAAYDEAIKLIRKVGGLMKKQKQLLQYEHYLAEMSLQFKPKRNFIKLLDGVAWEA